MVGPEDVLSFWLDEVGPSGWYRSDSALDATDPRRFQDDMGRCRAKAGFRCG